MFLSARRSVRLWVVVFTIIVCPLVLAQRPVVPAQHLPPVAPVHVQSPPVYRAPIAPPPVMRPPVMYAPRLGSPMPVTVPMTGGVGMGIVRPPIRPIRPHPPVIFVYNPLYLYGGPYWAANFCWWATCGTFLPWIVEYPAISSPGPVTYVSQVLERPVYIDADEREDLPQLYLKNGAILNVTDYWVTEDQLHFTMIEVPGAKPVEHSMPFEELDLQKTIDANTSRGFRFLLRNEPLEQYVRDHPEGPPPVAVPPPK